MGPLSADKIFMMYSINEEEQKPNPVVERVKLIMIAGLFVVHANRYFNNKFSSNLKIIYLSYIAIFLGITQ